MSSIVKSTEAVARRCSIKEVFLEISQKFIGKHLCQSLFLQACNFIKQVPQACNFIKKGDSGTGVFL